ncbi:hypothetical protein ACP4OV_022787 [Aristida adscensionis]
MESILQDRSLEPHSLPLEDLKKITNNFSDELLIGKGGFGKVYKGVVQNGDMVAVKKLTLTVPGTRDKQFENEICHLMKLRHPNIVQLVGYCSETKNLLVPYNGKYVYAEKSERLLCLEYMPKGSLREHISGCLLCLQYLHEEWKVNNPIIHMDLKPPNILLDVNMVPKIADFGLSRIFGEEKTRTQTRNIDGTLGYMAPEYITRGIITKKLDIFSLGVIIIEIMTGRKNYPYESESSSEKFIKLIMNNWRNRMRKTRRYAYWKFDRQQIRRCIKTGLTCVKLDREERPTIGQIIQMLRGDESKTCISELELSEDICCPPLSSSPSSSCHLFEFTSSCPVRRAFSTSDLQGMNGSSPPRAVPSADDCGELGGGPFSQNVGCYGAEERKERIERYRAKRRRRNINKKITYACRKTLAYSGPWVNGEADAEADEWEPSDNSYYGEVGNGNNGCSDGLYKMEALAGSTGAVVSAFMGATAAGEAPRQWQPQQQVDFGDDEELWACLRDMIVE